MNKKNSWRVALDYYNQEKNAPVFKTQNMKVMTYMANLAMKAIKHGSLVRLMHLRKNVGITTYYGFHAKTQEGHKVNDYYRADLLFKF